ncbi:30S ribosomal protein S16 [Patescibacteria group bacterium]|nr:30S ribosomal protein S16 [Patescibacteria group bacterium]
MLAIKLSRIGKRKQPTYRLIILEKHKDPQGNYLELLGNYNPRTKQINLQAERIKYWLSKGAQPSNTVHNILVKQGVIEGTKKRAVKITKKRKEKAAGEKKEEISEKKEGGSKEKENKEEKADSSQKSAEPTETKTEPSSAETPADKENKAETEKPAGAEEKTG